jgi:hypothetical protein
MSLKTFAGALFTGLIFTLLLTTTSCNHKDNEIQATCFDEILNQEEQRVDCGGPNCPPCPPTCDDGVQNQDEQAPDCGGPECPPCGTCDDGIQNSVWVPALNMFVMESGVDCGFPCPNFCPPTCEDGVQNGDETGIDCGGANCPACPPPSCNDGVWNGNETGIDCGGLDCPPCATPTCSDGIQNQDETGIDCGGVCDEVCPDATCFDGIQNGSESGIDCGGICPTICPPPNCNDGVQNQGEEWIDCGGPCPNVCPTCDDGVQNGPEGGLDCVIGDYPNYSGGTCEQCPTCNDGILNQGETAIDCGGPFCDECEMYMNGTLVGSFAYIGENFEVQQAGFDIIFTSSQTIGGQTRILKIKVPLSMNIGDMEDITIFQLSPAIEHTNLNGVVYQSVEMAGSQMEITFKNATPDSGPKRIEGTITMGQLDNVDIVTGGSIPVAGISFGLNYN